MDSIYPTRFVSRRKLFSGAAAALGALSLAACVPNTDPVPVPSPTPSPVPPAPAPTVSNIMKYITAITGGLQAILPSINGLLPTALYTKVSGYVTQAATLSAQIASALGAGLNAAGMVTAFINVAEQILSLLSGSGVAIPGAVSQVLSWAKVLLPVIASVFSVGSGRRLTFPAGYTATIQPAAAADEQTAINAAYNGILSYTHG